MPSGAWYAFLHRIESGFHMKSSDGIQRIPNAVRVYLSLAESVGTRYSQICLERAISGSFDFPSIEPSEYTNWHTFAADYACYSFLRKFEGAADQAYLAKKAIADFKEVELVNCRVNRHLRSNAPYQVYGVGSCISAARRKIAQILGSFHIEEFFDSCEWGPGATSSLTADVATLDQKILEPLLSVTRRALPIAKRFLERDIHMFAARAGILPDGDYSVLPCSNFLITESSRFTTVPKDWKSRRGIDIQPTFNLFLQKGVGAMLRRRLKRVGIDLDDQSRNQWLASVAQRLGLSTIDLAKASDSVSFALVEELLPREWFAVLHSLRTDYSSINGSIEYLHKFSAMGNGYTFELESLIFYALLRGMLDDWFNDRDAVVGVYGDDLIIPSTYSKAAIRLLKEVGFSTNVDKTFIEGRFYESCGKHYFDGIEVTPVFQKEDVVDVPSAIRCANRILRWALRLGRGDYYDGVAQTAHKTAVSLTNSLIDVLNARRWVRAVEHGRKEPKPVVVPIGPWYLTDDNVLLSTRAINYNIHGVAVIDQISFQAVKIPADNMALLATTLRRGCVTETPFLGVVTPRGLTRIVFSKRKISRRYGEVPGWLTTSVS